MLQAVEKTAAVDAVQEAFPDVDPGVVPLGARVLVQVRSVSLRTAGGIYLAPETREDKKWNTQVARVVALGPLAFCNRETGKPWTEGFWVRPGDFVRVPRWNGDRWEREIPGTDEAVRFVMFNDHELIGKLTMNPLEMKEYIL